MRNHAETAATRGIGLGRGVVVLVVTLTLGCLTDPQGGRKPQGQSLGSDERDVAVRQLLAEMRSSGSDAPPSLWRTDHLFDPSEARDKPAGRPGAFWQRVRKAFPFGFQGIALSTIEKDGSCAIVVAEPPPNVGFADLKDLIQDAAIVRKRVGHDGSFYDVIGSLRGGAAQIGRQVQLLSLLLFQTDYGAYIYREPFHSGGRTTSKYALDVQPTPAELRSWLYAEGVRFEPVGAGGALTLSDVLRQESPTVYRVPEDGLIAWRIPDGTSFTDSLAEAREFSLESDLVVGAIRDRGLMILGRQQVAPYDVLQPLRVETMALLSSVAGKTELAQSYQRMNPGAGPYTVEYDWAPILLSPELVDTEYGELLNLADQLLKSWSSNGDVQYERFEHPNPPSWPFEKPLLALVNEQLGASTVTYNWNTTGAGYMVEIEGAKVFAPYRTGSLPISYIPGEDARTSPQLVRFEEQAYNWFASLGNPLLTRVVQYATLFQIFHNLGVKPPPEPAPSSNAPEQAFHGVMSGLWRYVDALDDGAVEELAESFPVAKRFERLADPKNDRRIEKADPSQLMSLFSALMESKDAHKTMHDAVQRGMQNWRALSESERASAEERGSSLGGEGTAEISKDVGLFLAAAAAHEQLPDRFASAVPSTGDSWTHTPAVVISTAGFFSPEVIGGHNVRSGATEFVLDDNISVGAVRIDDGRIRVNSKDLSRARSVLREGARGFQSGFRSGDEAVALESKLSRMLSLAPTAGERPPHVALSLPKVTSAPKPLPSQVSLVSRLTLAPPPRVSGLLSAPADSIHRISVIKDANQFWVAGPVGLEPVATSTLADASELASLRARSISGRASRKPLEFQFTNLSDVERDTAMRNVRRKAGERGYSEDVVAVVAKEQPGFRKLSPADYDFANPKIHIEESQVIDGERFSKVTVELTPKRQGVVAVVIEFFIRVKGAISDLQLSEIAQAIQVRVAELFGHAATDFAERAPDPFLLLQRELNHVARLHGVEIETRVHHAGGDRTFTDNQVQRWTRHA